MNDRIIIKNLRRQGSTLGELAATRLEELLGMRTPANEPDPAPEPAPEPNAVERDIRSLRTTAEAMGIRVDKRWGEQRLVEEIATAQELASQSSGG